jgi:beta-phosphoglucomutase family hydrolase
LYREAMAGFLFDMDGVVCHNMPAHVEAWRRFLRGHGIEIELRDFLENTMGMPTRDVLGYYLKRPVSAEESAALGASKEALYRKIYGPKRRAAAGLRSFIKEARGAGHRLGLGTGSTSENVAFILDGLDLRKEFHAVVEAADVKRGKPHPETFLTLAKRMGVPPRECVVFEDSLLGEEAARRAGMTVVAVTTSHAAHEFKTAALAARDFRGLSLKKVLALVG